jgi:NADH:ubiquinone oxidoreductase subunit 3 (subunit A)
MQIFKEVYLPVIIAGIALILIFVFIVGSIVRAVQRNQYDKQMALEASIAAQEEHERLTQEATNLLSIAF